MPGLGAWNPFLGRDGEQVEIGAGANCFVWILKVCHFFWLLEFMSDS